MIGLIKDLLGPKAEIRMVIRTTLSLQAALAVQALVRSYDLPGFVQVVRGSHTIIQLEGPKHRLQSLMMRLQQTRLTNQPTILDVTWMTYSKKFEVFRVAT